MTPQEESLNMKHNSDRRKLHQDLWKVARLARTAFPTEGDAEMFRRDFRLRPQDVKDFERLGQLCFQIADSRAT